MSNSAKIYLTGGCFLKNILEVDSMCQSRSNVSVQPDFLQPQSQLLVCGSTQLKNISQNGNLPQIGVNMKKYLKPPPRLRFLNPINTYVQVQC